MKSKSAVKAILLFVLTVCLPAGVSAGEDSMLYQRALRSAREGKYDFAYMNYRSIVNGYGQSRFREKALFGIGEYYLIMRQFDKSEQHFNQLLEEYPETKLKLFALAHLYRAARAKGEQKEIDRLKQNIINSQRVSFVFKKRKDLKFRSPLGINFKAVIHIDRIEFFAEGDPFAKIVF